MGHVVVLYVQSGCDDSEKVQNWLATHGVDFTVKNVTEDESAMAELAVMKAFMTPTLLVDDERIAGYRPSRLQEIFC